MEMLIAALGLGVAAYVFVSGRRNRDPLNKKCAIEITDYLVSSDALEPDDIYQIFKRNGLFQTQARHGRLNGRGPAHKARLSDSGSVRYRASGSRSGFRGFPQ